jgi:hypothetical protein
MLGGYPGSFARGGDCLIMSRPVKSTDSAGPAFGDPVILNSDNTFSKFGAAGTLAAFAGVAVREVKQATSYLPSPTTGGYLPGQPCDVLERGDVSVVCNVGTPTAGGAVYVRTVANAGIPAGVVGGFEAAADGGNTIQWSKRSWSAGGCDWLGRSHGTASSALYAQSRRTSPQ